MPQGKGYTAKGMKGTPKVKAPKVKTKAKSLVGAPSGSVAPQAHAPNPELHVDVADHVKRRYAKMRKTGLH